MTDRSSYEQQIQRQKIVRIQFRAVSINGKKPVIAGCHTNVKEWVDANQGDQIVRGWAVYATSGYELLLCAHSIIKGADGVLFDITPLEREIGDARQFLFHVGNDEEFFAIVQQGETIIYPLPEAERLDWMSLFPFDDENSL